MQITIPAVEKKSVPTIIKNESNNKKTQLKTEVIKLKESIIELSTNMSIIMAK